MKKLLICTTILSLFVGLMACGGAEVEVSESDSKKEQAQKSSKQKKEEKKPDVKPPKDVTFAYPDDWGMCLDYSKLDALSDGWIFEDGTFEELNIDAQITSMPAQKVDNKVQYENRYTLNFRNGDKIDRKYGGKFLRVTIQLIKDEEYRLWHKKKNLGFINSFVKDQEKDPSKRTYKKGEWVDLGFGKDVKAIFKKPGMMSLYPCPEQHIEILTFDFGDEHAIILAKKVIETLR